MLHSAWESFVSFLDYHFLKGVALCFVSLSLMLLENQCTCLPVCLLLCCCFLYFRDTSYPKVGLSCTQFYLSLISLCFLKSVLSDYLSPYMLYFYFQFWVHSLCFLINSSIINVWSSIYLIFRLLFYLTLLFFHLSVLAYSQIWKPLWRMYCYIFLLEFFDVLYATFLSYCLFLSIPAPPSPYLSLFFSLSVFHAYFSFTSAWQLCPDFIFASALCGWLLHSPFQNCSWLTSLFWLQKYKLCSFPLLFCLSRRSWWPVHVTPEFWLGIFLLASSDIFPSSYKSSSSDSSCPCSTISGSTPCNWGMYCVSIGEALRFCPRSFTCAGNHFSLLLILSCSSVASLRHRWKK